MKKVFIDGSAGTTGLRIEERLARRDDVTLMRLSDAERKDPKSRARALNACDIAFLCLPDDAARESATLTENPDVVLIDASTAHRTEPGWVYGFPELAPGQLEKIRQAKRIAVPGCHATGFIALVLPLIEAGIIDPALRLVCHSITGYSGGGKQMIAEYEGADRSPLLGAPRQYGLGQNHKHLKEMTAITGLCSPPLFSPIVADFYSGMEVTVPLFCEDLRPGFGMEDIRAAYRARYTGPVVTCTDGDEHGFLSAAALSGKDAMAVSVHGNGERMILVARYDNLGKGASGAAVECMNIVLGADPAKGLEV